MNVHPRKGAEVEWLRKNREQLLAEARTLYEANEQWWLTAPEDRQRALNNKNFQSIDWFTECAITAYEANGGGKLNGFTVGQFARAIEPNLSAQSRSHSLSAALLRAGFIKIRSNGVTAYVKEGKQKHNDSGLSAIKALHGEPSIRARLKAI